MNCKYCNKLCKNNNSLAQHQIRCKENPNAISFVTTNLVDHVNKIRSGEKKGENHFTKSKRLGLPIPIVSEETRKKIGDRNKNIIWTKEKRENHSKSMIKATINNPESYSSKNVCGRTKLIGVENSYGESTFVNGGWEKLFIDYLNLLKIKWTNKISESIFYMWEGKERRYYPDFYLPEFDIYVEVKGYERERDREKWKSVDPKRLIYIKKNEINKIKKGIYDIIYVINSLNNFK